MFHRYSERRLWSLVILYLVGIYTSAYFVQFVMTALRDRGLLRLSLGIGSALLAVLSVAYLARSRPRRSEWLLILLALLIYGWLALRMRAIPQEGLHLIQYGLLGGLFLVAFEARKRTTGRGSPMLAAMVCTGLAGWVDEGVQAILPNRTYDLRDVRLNALSGLLFLTLVGVRRKIRKAEKQN